jgi:hypothetical protein
MNKTQLLNLLGWGQQTEWPGGVLWTGLTEGSLLFESSAFCVEQQEKNPRSAPALDLF